MSGALADSLADVRIRSSQLKFDFVLLIGTPPPLWILMPVILIFAFTPLLNSNLIWRSCLEMGLSCCIPLLRFSLHSSAFQPLARRILYSNPVTKTTLVPAKTLNRVDKFCESLWKLTVYTVLLALGTYALHDQPWISNSSALWEGWPDQSIPGKVRAYYAAEGAFYTASVFMLLLWEERRKDFWVMLLHHVVTFALITASYSLSYARVGSLIMLLHDPSDVFLEAAKLLNYAGLDLPATAAFAGLLCSWLLLRLVLLPFWVIRSCMFGVKDVLGYVPQHNPPLSGLLCVLVALHAYWFSLIARIAWRQITTGVASDSREDDE